MHAAAACVVVALLLLTLWAATVTAQTNRFLNGYLERICVRRGLDIVPPGGDTTVNATCTSTQYVCILQTQVTAGSAAGALILDVYLDDPGVAALFTNSSTTNPTVPPVNGFAHTHITFNMTEILVAYELLPNFPIPTAYLTQIQQDTPADYLNCQGQATLLSTDPTSPACYAGFDNPLTDPYSTVIPQTSLPAGMQECWEAACGDCEVGVPSTNPGGGKRFGGNTDYFVWQGPLYETFDIAQGQMLMTIGCVIAPEAAPEQLVLLGVVQGPSNPNAPNMLDGPGRRDPITNASLPDQTDYYPGRTFQTAAFSADGSVMFEIESVGRVGNIPGLVDFTFVGLNDGGTGTYGWDEGRTNPRTLSTSECAFFDASGGAGPSPFDVVLCPFPSTWFVAQNFDGQFMVGQDCCNCFGITSQSLYTDPALQAQVCWNQHLTCVPGVDITSTATSVGPQYFIVRQLNFRIKNFNIMCYGTQNAPGVTPVDPSTDSPNDPRLTIPAGVYAANGSGACGSAVPTCDYCTVSDAERARRYAAVQLQAGWNLPFNYDNTGRSNWYTSAGVLLYQPPSNFGALVTTVTQFDGGFGGVIVELPSVILQPASGTQCSGEVGASGTFYFDVVNQSPIPGDFTVVITCSDPAYRFPGGASTGVGVSAAPFIVEKSLSYTFTRTGLQPNPSGVTCTVTLYNYLFQPTGQTLSTNCREEAPAQAGPVGQTPPLNPCVLDPNGSTCAVSNFWVIVILILLVAGAAFCLFLIIKRMIGGPEDLPGAQT
jgi:hypothetical protein